MNRYPANEPHLEKIQKFKQHIQRFSTNLGNNGRVCIAHRFQGLENMMNKVCRAHPTGYFWAMMANSSASGWNGAPATSE